MRRGATAIAKPAWRQDRPLRVRRRTEPLTPRALKRTAPFRNDMPALIKALSENARRRGPATPNADARRTAKAAS